MTTRTRVERAGPDHDRMPAWKFALARRMRKKPTGLERDGAAALKTIRPRLMPQVPMGGYIVDRYCPIAMVAVEIDGPFHEPVKDARRDAHLAERGVLTIRIPMDADFYLAARHVQYVIRARLLHKAKRGGDYPGHCAICLAGDPTRIVRNARGVLRGLMCSGCVALYGQYIQATIS